jgi:adenosylcobinamide-GDP ribazoletransferase
MDEITPTSEDRPASLWIALLAAFQFLTIAPPLIHRPFTKQEISGAVSFFPVVGAMLGVILALVDALLAFIAPPTARSALTLTTWVLLTGALHLDGFLDSCDGLLGGGTPDKRLEIMRDERVGAYALAGGILLLLLKFSALLSLTQHWEALVLAPTLGRWGMSLAIFAFPYARPDGLGRSMKDGTGWLQIMIATLLTLVTAWYIGQFTGLVLVILAGVTLWIGARFTLRRIPGLTGDVYGALNEVIELVVLLALVVLASARLVGP